ncbi:33 kDa inner dynein arm light chain, axonemal,putative [Leishmania mexicana MHOM/GT/2001/U1103]|uniref:33 kDa inner dynein arm light chain, axonemal,putative n=1 Tax=Leishmania mexicana (strain MHOM/GT/2001/U1103) TaxID=929439 RepID=E9B3V2_LEIMU|nr:33 kDa inner dynein arm light chain, axonemal,putative [Leishmania mexicana MHOM/GT/2001/U1103]CBZ29919.1 33 kDa inner dynein arm light chain, axonemal,putative [Leishmania mexicana MHOM/GT/2001/U1103]
MNMPHLMRHIQDTGALLDTLFPIQRQSTAAVPPCCTGSPSCVSGDSEAAEEDAEQLVSVQTVSAAPAFREDVVALHATLQKRLEDRRARPTGLCPIRRALYCDLFSELVRQVTVEEPARGLLLARVREEAEHAIQVHAALLCEGQRFVAGKLMQEKQDALALKERIAALRQEKVALEVQKHELLETLKEMEQLFEEERQLRRKQRQDEVKYLRHANQQLSLRLKMETERESAATEVEGSSEAAPATS